jgi:serine protease Do
MKHNLIWMLMAVAVVLGVNLSADAASAGVSPGWNRVIVAQEQESQESGGQESGVQESGGQESGESSGSEGSQDEGAGQAQGGQESGGGEPPKTEGGDSGQPPQVQGGQEGQGDSSREGAPPTEAEQGTEQAESMKSESGEQAGETSEGTETPEGEGTPSEGATPPTEAEVAAAAEMVRFEAVVLGEREPDLADLRTMQARVRQLVEQLRPAVVGIRMGGSQGSGVIVTGDGYVMTAAHVVGKTGQKAEIVFPDGSTKQAVVLGTDASSDSGMLRILDSGPWPYAELGESSSLRRGQWLMALGHPGGFDLERSAPVRVGRLLMEPGRTTLQTDCTLVGGDSGGPLFDLDGRVVGIHSRISRRIQQNYHVSADIYTSQWDDMTKEPAPSLGFSLKPADETDELIVSRVGDDGPAGQAGLEVGDKILKINDTPVATRDELRDAIGTLKPFTMAKVTVWRDDAEKELEIEVGAR